MLTNQFEVEERVLGAVINNYTSWSANVVSMLSVEDMCSSSTRWLLSCIKGLAARQVAVDLMTVSTELKLAQKNERIPAEADMSWLVSVCANASTANLEYFARQIKANAKMTSLLNDIDNLKTIIETTQDPAMAMAEARTLLSGLELEQKSKGAKRIDEWAEKYIEHRVNVYEGKVSGGLTLGVPGMSHAFGQIGMTDFIVIAGRPGTGKTELAIAVCNELAVRQGKAVLYKSLEMEGMEVAERAILELAGLSVDSVVNGEMFEETTPSGLIGHAIERLKGKNFYVDESTGCGVEEIASQARQFCSTHANVGALVIDYVGLMELGTGHKRHDLAIGHITRHLKLLAKEMSIPVIALFQLSRDVEKAAGGRRPVAADLRDSGSIEQDADKIVIVHRECIKNSNTPMRNTAELLNVKRRRGQPCNGYMEFKNGHFIGIPDEKQAMWRNIAEGTESQGESARNSNKLE